MIEPTITFSDYYNIDPKLLENLGTFDPFLSADTPLAIDPKLLDEAPDPELRGAHDEVLARFGDVFKLLRLSKQREDKPWRSARVLLTFPEFRGASLGTSQTSGNGSGWGPTTTAQVLQSAKEIVQAGLDDPAFFELLALFETGIGADRLGDMLGNIILPRLAAYTKRVCNEIQVPTEAVTVAGHSYDLPVWTDERARKRYVVLVPHSILSDMPVALDRRQVEYVASRNAEARDFLNRRIGQDWRRRVVSTSPDGKSATRAAFFSNIPYFRQFIEHYRRQTPVPYDFESDPKALRLIHDVLAWAESNAIPLTLAPSPSKENVFDLVRAIVLHFKQQVEQNRLAKALYVQGKPRREDIAQAVFQAVADAHCKHNDLDLSAEVNAGRGPVDFKFSNGRRARVLVELKLSNSTQLLHGFEKQLLAYEAAEDTDLSIYLVIYNGFGDSRLEQLEARVAEAQADGKRMPEVVIVDATPKPSGSKA